MRSRAMPDGEMSTYSHGSGEFPTPQEKVFPLDGKVPTLISSDMLITPDAPWDPINIAKRLDAQAERLGMSRTALLKKAKIHAKAVHDMESGHWPNLRKLVDLAKAFKFPGGVPELLGLTEAPDNRCDPRLLHVALELVASAMDLKNHDNPLITKPHIVAGLAAVAHHQLVELRRIDSNALDNAAALHLISVMLRSELANFERAKL